MMFTSSPDANMLQAVSQPVTVTADGLTAGTTARLFTISVGTTTLFSYNAGVVTTDASVTASVTPGATSIAVLLTPVAPHTDGSVQVLALSYQDSGTATTTSSVAYVYGQITLLAQYPQPSQGNCPPDAPIILTGTVSAPLSPVTITATVDGLPVSRPDFEILTHTSSTLFTYFATGRRLYPANKQITVDLTFSVSIPLGGISFVGVATAHKSATYYFHTRKEITSQYAALPQTRLDQPYLTTLMETLRRALSVGLRPSTSSAPLAVLAFYAVQRSGLGSFASQLPRSYASQTALLLAQDIASPLTVLDAVGGVALFWPALLQLLQQSAVLGPEVLATLQRAWNSSTPQDQVAALCCVMLYAEDRVA